LDAGPQAPSAHGRKVVQLTAGRAHSCALLSDRAVKCWGKGANGRLGLRSTQDVGDDEAPGTAPDVNVGGPVVSTSAGSEHQCVVLETGRVRCWGRGDDGRLGYGATHDVGDDEDPSAEGNIALSAPASQVAAGRRHTCALLVDGRVQCWGDNSEGALGTGAGKNIGDDEHPDSQPPLDLGEKVTQLAATSSTCALLQSGSVRCWGPVRGSTADRFRSAANTPPVEVGGPVTRLFAGPMAHSYCGMMASGSLRCWGDLPEPTFPETLDEKKPDPERVAIHAANKFGFPTPATVGDLPAPARWESVGLAAEFACLLRDGHVSCWGSGEHGTLGAGQKRVPLNSAVAVPTAPATQLAVGGYHVCALLDDSRVYCWGAAEEGRLGRGGAGLSGDGAFRL
jgi:alpha-tubulin suppressor-like RCC1 family protein